MIPPRNIHARRHEDAHGDIARVAASLAALSAHDIDATVQRLARVPRVAHHIHDQDAGGVEAVDDVARGHADGADEEGCFFGDDHVDQLVQESLRVVVVRGPRGAAYGWEGEVDAEGEGGGCEEGFELVDHVEELGGRVA